MTSDGLTIEGGKITSIEQAADKARVGRMNIELLAQRRPQSLPARSPFGSLARQINDEPKTEGD
jgi:hypothetical protein